jgi:polyisoprenoid-binding protein YceI
MAQSASSGSGSRRRLSIRSRKVQVAVAIVVVAAVAAGAVGLWYVLLGPSGPAAVTAAPPAIPSDAAVAAPASLDGTWTVNDSLGRVADGTASFAGYRVQEQLVGIGGHTAVGRTAKVTGSMTLAGSTVDNVQITADMTALVSDDQFRDQQLKRQAIETDKFPTAMFETSQPVQLGAVPADGQIVSVDAQGALTLHGVTRTVTMHLQARRLAGIIAVSGSMDINFSDYSIQKPTSFSVLSVNDHGIMEVHLLFTHS